jgi:hypothetical protein
LLQFTSFNKLPGFAETHAAGLVMNREAERFTAGRRHTERLIAGDAVRTGGGTAIDLSGDNRGGVTQNLSLALIHLIAFLTVVSELIILAAELVVKGGALAEVKLTHSNAMSLLSSATR